jgi:hypothetical protein
MPIGTTTIKRMGHRNRDTASFSNHSERSRSKNSRSQSNTNNVANAKRNYDRYIALARNAVSTGDLVEIENFYQHAEHYLRQMNLQPV